MCVFSIALYFLPVTSLKGWAACSHGPEGANPGCSSQITMERKQYAKETWQPLGVELLGTVETMALYRTPPKLQKGGGAIGVVVVVVAVFGSISICMAK